MFEALFLGEIFSIKPLLHSGLSPLFLPVGGAVPVLGGSEVPGAVGGGAVGMASLKAGLFNEKQPAQA